MNKRLTSRRVLRLHPPTHWTQFALRLSACVRLRLFAFACVRLRLRAFACVPLRPFASACVYVRLQASVCVCVLASAGLFACCEWTPGCRKENKVTDLVQLNLANKLLSFCSLVPRPRPAFRCLPCCKRHKAGRVPGNEASLFVFIASYREMLYKFSLTYRYIVD